MKSKSKVQLQYDTHWVCYYENKPVFKFKFIEFHSAAVVKAATILTTQFASYLGNKEFCPLLMVVKQVKGD